MTILPLGAVLLFNQFLTILRRKHEAFFMFQLGEEFDECITNVAGNCFILISIFRSFIFLTLPRSTLIFVVSGSAAASIVFYFLSTPPPRHILK